MTLGAHAVLSATAAVLITLDAGHQPEAPGAISARGRPELLFNQQMVALLRVLLAGPGVKLSSTRGEECVELAERAERANRTGADLLLSIHHDSVKPEHMESWDEAGQCRIQSRAARGFSLHVRGDQPESVRIARLLGQELLDAGFRPTTYHTTDYTPIDLERGVYDRRKLKLLNSSQVPTVLVECGFIIEPDEEQALRSAPVRQRIAEAIARGVRKALRFPPQRPAFPVQAAR